MQAVTAFCFPGSGETQRLKKWVLKEMGGFKKACLFRLNEFFHSAQGRVWNLLVFQTKRIQSLLWVFPCVVKANLPLYCIWSDLTSGAINL